MLLGPLHVGKGVVWEELGGFGELLPLGFEVGLEEGNGVLAEGRALAADLRVDFVDEEVDLEIKFELLSLFVLHAQVVGEIAIPHGEKHLLLSTVEMLTIRNRLTSSISP